MSQAISLQHALRRPAILAIMLAAFCALGVAVWAQVGGERGIAPVASTSDIQVSGVEVDVHADTGTEASPGGG